MTVKRFGVSLESELLNGLDEMVDKHLYANRSQAIRHLIAKHLVEEKKDSEAVVAGAIVIVYDHNLKELHEKVNALQHEYHCLILAGQHIHLDDHNCLELIAVKGKAYKLQKLADKLKAIKGIKNGDLLITSAS